MQEDVRIGFITYEFPPDIGKGGIATYVNQAAKLLQQRGHDVEVFCGSHTRTISEKIDGVLIHRVLTTAPENFKDDCLAVFTERHNAQSFDLIESPEIHGNAFEIKKRFPRLPMVVKLHMALFIQMRLFNFYTSKFTKLRFFLGGLRRGRIRLFGHYKPETDIDYQITKLADGIVAPSEAQKAANVKEWKIPADKIVVIPYPFVPPPELLAIPINAETGNVVTFVGKLNVHKGIVNLVKAVPQVVKKYPDVIFRLIGTDSYFSAGKMKMSEYIKNQLKGFEKNYVIEGALEYGEVLERYATSAVCIFPSVWENFGLVCLEAMSAGRAVIGSKEGGMNKILNSETGRVIDPLNVNEISSAIITLLDNKKLRLALGEAARKDVLKHYNNELIGQKMETHYRETIDKAEAFPS